MREIIRIEISPYGDEWEGRKGKFFLGGIKFLSGKRFPDSPFPYWYKVGEKEEVLKSLLQKLEEVLGVRRLYSFRFFSSPRFFSWDGENFKLLDASEKKRLLVFEREERERKKKKEEALEGLCEGCQLHGDICCLETPGTRCNMAPWQVTTNLDCKDCGYWQDNVYQDGRGKCDCKYVYPVCKYSAHGFQTKEEAEGFAEDWEKAHPHSSAQVWQLEETKVVFS